MEQGRDSRIVAGSILVLIGLALLATQLVGGLGQSIWIFLIGVLFLAAYLARRAYGFLVAGGILIGVGLGRVGEQAFGSLDGINGIGLGIGFLSIYLIDRVYRGPTPWWPLIPGGILLISGFASLGQPISDAVEYVWPIGLIVVGLIVIFGATAVRRRS